MGKNQEKGIKGQAILQARKYRQLYCRFYCPAAKLIIELDGGQHYSDAGKKKDEMRDNYLKHFGFTVLRFSDRDVLKNIEGVLEKIYEFL